MIKVTKQTHRRTNAWAGATTMIAVILFCCGSFAYSALADGKEYRRMQMKQFFKRNIPEYYTFLKDGRDASANNAISKYGITVEEVYEHYLGEGAAPHVQTEVHDVIRENAVTSDSVETVSAYHDTAAEDIRTASEAAEDSAAAPGDHRLFRLYFSIGDFEINENISGNRDELARMNDYFSALASDGTVRDYLITITGMCSPEGTFTSNLKLAKCRCEAVDQYLDLPCDVEIRNECEGWQILDGMIAEDTVLAYGQKCEYIDICETADRDLRETMLRQKPFYEYLKTALYPYLRTVFISVIRVENQRNQVSL